jgi:hypothetical protein
MKVVTSTMFGAVKKIFAGFDVKILALHILPD